MLLKQASRLRSSLKVRTTTDIPESTVCYRRFDEMGTDIRWFFSANR
jgi:hypothetical protein